jgi:hypothetical protein
VELIAQAMEKEPRKQGNDSFGHPHGCHRQDVMWVAVNAATLVEAARNSLELAILDRPGNRGWGDPGSFQFTRAQDCPG